MTIVFSRIAHLGSFILVILLLLLFSSCQSEEPDERPTPTTRSTAEKKPEPPIRILPTLYPTATPQPTAAAIETRPPLPTEVPNTPIPFDKSVVELSYSIPSLGLDRSLRANVSSVVELTDEAISETVTLRDQIGVIYELQQSLAELKLEPMPEECPDCVYFSYRLPLIEEQDEGLLTDKQMLASIENFTTAHLGPHFPTDTSIGYRRSATPYQAASSLALTSDGALWRWSAVDSQIETAATGSAFSSQLPLLLGDIELASLSEAYSGPCPEGAGVETIFISHDQGDLRIKFVCPELSLPAALIPLYQFLNEELVATLSDEEQVEPQDIIPLNSLLYYKRADGQEMTVLNDGLTNIVDNLGEVYTTTVAISEIISITEALVSDQGLLPGATAFELLQPENILFIRGPYEVFSVSWVEDQTPLDDLSMLLIDDFLDQLLNLLVIEGDEILDDDTDGTITPAPTISPAATITPRSTPEG